MVPIVYTLKWRVDPANVLLCRPCSIQETYGSRVLYETVILTTRELMVLIRDTDVLPLRVA